jgi:hypothetical protein
MGLADGIGSWHFTSFDSVIAIGMKLFERMEATALFSFAFSG